MGHTLGIRREDKNRWERRVPIIPQHVKELKEKHNIETIIQPSPIRVFSNKEYQEAGATVQENMSPCPGIFAVKEIPIDLFERGKTYLFFSHTTKGQQYNMPMLRRMMDLGCNLIDYEKIVDDKGRRLVFFGRFAGIAGMIDALWSFNKRLQWENLQSPFEVIQQTYHYNNIDDVKVHIVDAGRRIEQQGIPDSLTPLLVGFTGYGNVSRGAQEILDLLPVREIHPSEIESVYDNPSNKIVYKVVFKEEDTVEPISKDNDFELQDYYNHPKKYQGIFQQYLPYLSILMNCIYWNNQYPRLVTKEYLRNYFAKNKKMRLRVIGDISVDINGAIECTEKTTSPDNPVYVYNPLKDEIHDGFEGGGVVILAVDNLPCELPRESSNYFSEVLCRFIPTIVDTDFSEKNFDKLSLPPEIKNAVILYHGKLTPNYKYINKYL